MVLLPVVAIAQVKIPKGANKFTYWQFEYGENTDTSVITVLRDGDRITIVTPKPEGTLIQGYLRGLFSRQHHRHCHLPRQHLLLPHRLKPQRFGVESGEWKVADVGQQ